MLHSNLAPYSSLPREKVSINLILDYFQIIFQVLSFSYLFLQSLVCFLFGGFEAAKINFKIIACKNI